MITRRTALLAGAGVATLAAAGTGYLALNAGDPPEPPATPAVPGRVRWSNWSGLQSCDATAISVPRDAEEVQEILRSTKGPVRPVGAGHSFSALVPTQGTIVSLDRLNGLLSHDPKKITATVGAGTRLAALNEMLWSIGQSLPSLPDIDRQSLAGAIATATHGAGRQLTALHGAVSGLELVTPRGERLWCDNAQNPGIFHAARVSLGALGVVTSVRLQNRAPLRLARRTWFEPLGQALDAAMERSRTHRHYEFYYITFTGMAYCIAHDETADPDTPREANPENEGLEDLVLLRDWFSWAPPLRRLLAQSLMQGMEPESAVGPAWRLLSTARTVRFNEMEYHLPQDAMRTCLEEVIAVLERHSEVYMPVEVRFVAADDAWVSPFYLRPSASIAVHMGHTQDHRFFFSEVEPVFRRFAGRPHWGKLHSLKAAGFAALYPRWRDFLEVRATLDPEGRMLNAHLREVFGMA